MRVLKVISLAAAGALGFAGSAFSQEAGSALCRDVTFRGGDYAVCTFDASIDDIRLFHTDAAGEPLRNFTKLKKKIEAEGGVLLFAMNAGMYSKERAPIGHYIENGVETVRVNTNEGPGNFHLLPNGVFYVTNGGAGVLESARYKETAKDVTFATQSGPMLVIDGALHPAFMETSTSKKRRNGVGVTKDNMVVFVISDTPVTFHQFASFFRDELKTPDALYLDGTISRLYAPELGRNDSGAAMGPMVGVTVGLPRDTTR